jgi:small-conductance mechanosensitive channel
VVSGPGDSLPGAAGDHAAHARGAHLHRGSRAQARHDFILAALTGVGAVIAASLASTLGQVHGQALHQKLFAFVGAGAFLVLGIIAVQSASAGLSLLVAAGAGAPSGGAVRVLARLVGYVVVGLTGLGLLGVPLDHLLLGGVVTSVIVGIAAQQSLGNVFAGIVLLFSRPFVLGDRVRVRAGALGGIFDGVVTGMSLVYVTILTDDGPVNVPNSTFLAVGVGPAPPARDRN